MQYRELFLTTVTCCFGKVPWKGFRFYFSFYTLKNISRVNQVCWNYPSSITFSQLWRNSSQVAHLFEVTSSLVTWPEYSALIRLNGLIGFCSKKTRALVGFCCKTWTRKCLESGQYRLFWQNVFRVRIALYVENNARQSALFLL